jgi:voltage-gated potassium channel
VVVLIVDLAIIAFFIVAPIIGNTSTVLWVDYSIAVVLAADIAARMLASTDIPRQLKQLTFWVDIFILLTLLFPALLGNLGFLRILRLWSLSKSGFLWRPLKRFGYEQWRESGHSVVNLVTFLFVLSGFIYTFFFRSGAGINGYIDALYFTVATITTTGFGDIVLPGPWGKLTSIAAMIRCSVMVLTRCCRCCRCGDCHCVCWWLCLGHVHRAGPLRAPQGGPGHGACWH